MITRRSARLAASKADSPAPVQHPPPAKPKPPVKKRELPQQDRRKKVKIERNENPICFNLTSLDPVIEHVRRFSQNDSNAQHGVNLDSEILDQIALDGLSGITFARLLWMLDARIANLNCTNDQNCHDYIWSVIVKQYLRYPSGSNHVQAFYLDSRKISIQERNNDTNNDNNSSTQRKIVIDRQISLPYSTMKRFAKMDSLLYPVQDGQIMGSCANYLARVDITQELIEKFDMDGSISSMHSLNELYGLDNIHFVASQTLRSRAILPNWADPNINIKLREYCALELIGKSRSLGTVFPNDKALGRYRIMLMAKKFISQYQESNTSPIEHHIRRFSPDDVSSDKDLSFNTKPPSENGDDQELTLSRLCCNPHKLRADRSTLTIVYDTIARSEKGVTVLDLRRKLNIPRHHIRNHLKNLVSIELVHSHKRQRPPDKAIRVYKAVQASIYQRKKEIKIPTGIMANWDEPDLKAREILGNRRSSFTQAEDSLLILCRITSILIEPKLRLSWCVHKRVVRDILHDELIESHDKTSDACLRRIKYLKQLPNNIMSINELTAELLDDPDIIKLIHNKPMHSETRLNKLFIQILRVLRTKIPYLLGLTCSGSALKFFGKRNSQIPMGRAFDNEVAKQRPRGSPIELRDYEELKNKYELVDCDSVASISRSPTYEQAKNSVDVRFNNAALVTMANAMCNCFDKSDSTKLKLLNQWLLEKFYSSYHDKLISSMLSKLNKRSLVTRKCPTEIASSIVRTKVLTKLNQSVLFMLSRHHSNSLVQLAQPISQLYKIDLSENNEMASFALLTSLCSSSSFNLDLELKIPTNVVGIDQGNENFKSVCDKASDSTREILDRFMSRCGGSSCTPTSGSEGRHLSAYDEADNCSANTMTTTTAISSASTSNNKMDDSRRALFLLRHELKTQALDKCGNLSDCLIVQPCNVKFCSDKELKWERSALDTFLAKAQPVVVKEEIAADQQQIDQQQQQPANWLVKSFRLPKDKDLITERQFDSHKLAVEFSARLWKRIDGSINKITLFKLLESLLSWIIVFPGIERDLLEREFSLLMPNEHLFELLALMEDLKLIEKHKLAPRRRKPRLFGYTDQLDPTADSSHTETYEATVAAYVQFCQLSSELKGSSEGKS